MADTSNLSNFLEDVADAIRTKKETTDKIPAEQFDQEIASIETGIDTSDATATADDIRIYKTAYVNGEKIEGTLSGGSNLPAKRATVSSTNYLGLIASDDKDLLLSKGSPMYGSPDMVLNAIGLTSDKLMKGNTILGMEGTAEGSGTEINNQDKTITENGTYTADEGYTGLGNVEVNVSQKVKLFNNKTEMNNFLNDNVEELQLNDKAVVYGEKKIVPIGNEQRYTSIYLPEQIILDEPLTSDVTFYNGIEYSHGGGGGNQTITPDSWNMYFHSNMAYAGVTYTSEDGQTYTRGEVNVEGHDGWGASFNWDDTTNILSIEDNEDDTKCFYRAVNGHINVLTKFFTSVKPVFDGIYNVEEVSTKSVARLVETATNVINKNIVTPTLANIGNDEWGYYDTMFGVKTRTDIIQGLECDGFDILYTGNNSSSVQMVYDGNKIMAGYFGSYKTSSGPSSETYSVNYYTIENGIRTKHTEPKKYSEQQYKYTSGNYTYVFFPFFETTNKNDCKVLLVYSSLTIRNAASLSTRSSVNRSAEYSQTTTLKQYNRAENQLSIDNVNQLLPGVIAYGPNGDVIGDGTIYSNLDDYEILTNIFNMTPVQEDYYRPLPSKNITDITTKSKIIYLKEDNIIGSNKHYIAKPTVQYHHASTYVRKYLNNQCYDPVNNKMVSIQYEYIDNVAQYTFVIEDYVTKEVIYQEDIIPMNYSYAGLSVVNGYAFLRTYNADNQWYIYKYDLATLTKTTLDSFTTSSSSNGEVFKNNGKYVLYQDTRQTGTNSVKCTTKLHFPDINKTVVLRNETVSTTRSRENYCYYVDLADKIYVYSACAYGGGHKLLSVNKTSFAVTNMNLSNYLNRTSQLNDIPKNGFEDSNYIDFGWILVPKNNSSVSDNYSYVEIYDTNGTLIYNKEDTNNKHFIINGNHYVYTGGTLYQVDSYTVTKNSNYIIKCVCSNSYRLPGNTYFYYILDQGAGAYHNTSILYDMTSLQLTDNGYSFTVTDAKTTGDIILKQYVETTSIDYDYSVIYTGKDSIIQKNVDDIFAPSDYTNTISPVEYEQAIKTTNEILGEEV